jgi:hypothetical protein
MIELSTEDKLNMNHIIGGLHVELERIRTMVTKPFEFPETEISTRVEIIKEDLDTMISKISDIGYEHKSKRGTKRSKAGARHTKRHHRKN